MNVGYHLSMRKLYDDRCSPFASEDTDDDYDADFDDVFPENE